MTLLCPPNNNKTTTGTLIVADPTHGVKVDSAVIAEPFRAEIRQRVKQLKQSGIQAPLLVGLLANADPAAKQYAEWTGRACTTDGLRYELRELNDPIHVEQALWDANDDPRVHGIIVYYPIFGSGGNTTKKIMESFSGASQDDYLRDSVSYQCDVEGLCHTYRSNLYRNIRYLNENLNHHHTPHVAKQKVRLKCLLPCTALAVIKILEACPHCYNNNNNNNNVPQLQHLRNHHSGRNGMQGKIVTVINRSEIVGRPVAAMLCNDGAIVYSIDIDSIYKFELGRVYPCTEDGETTVESCVRSSSVVITGVPTRSYRLPVEWIAAHTVVINVASYKNVDEDALLRIPGVIYVPMVGKVTVAMLERNLMRLFDQFHNPTITTTTTSSTTITSATTPEKPSSASTSSSSSSSWPLIALQVYIGVAVTATLVTSQLLLRVRKK